jgi:hypothetical protein
MSKKSRRRNRMLAALALGLGASKLMKPDVSGAKAMKATEIKKESQTLLKKEELKGVTL